MERRWAEARTCQCGGFALHTRGLCSNNTCNCLQHCQGYGWHVVVVITPPKPAKDLLTINPHPHTHTHTPPPAPSHPERRHSVAGCGAGAACTGLPPLPALHYSLLSSVTLTQGETTSEKHLWGPAPPLPTAAEQGL
eukprot:1149422-Pelagomonas_calceolata.AAC.4